MKYKSNLAECQDIPSTEGVLQRTARSWTKTVEKWAGCSAAAAAAAAVVVVVVAAADVAAAVVVVAVVVAAVVVVGLSCTEAEW